MVPDELRIQLLGHIDQGLLPLSGQKLSIIPLNASQHTHQSFRVEDGCSQFYVKWRSVTPWGANPLIELHLRKELGVLLSEKAFWQSCVFSDSRLQIFPWFEGHTVTSFSPKHIDHVATQLAVLHALPVSDCQLPKRSIPLYMAKGFNKLEESLLRDDWRVVELQQRWQRIHTALPFDQLPQVLCHFDPTPGNWMWSEAGGLRLIDWEYAALSIPWMDLASVLLTLDDDTDRKAFLTRYKLVFCESDAIMDWFDADQASDWVELVAIMNDVWEILRAEGA